jgi:hypothetical protein
MVRPRKAQDARKGHVVALRVSKAEKLAFARAAERAGASGVSMWIRMLALKEVQRDAKR